MSNDCIIDNVGNFTFMNFKTRAIITIARDMGYTVEEQLFTRDEVYIADEAFFNASP